jgi:hypothetical protein
MNLRSRRKNRPEGGQGLLQILLDNIREYAILTATPEGVSAAAQQEEVRREPD